MYPRPLHLQRRFVLFETLLLLLTLALTGTLSRTRADTGTCSGQSLLLPFTDTMGNPFFCFIAELYALGITGGTTPTTYSPNDPVTRAQMAVFLDRTHDSALKRGNRRAALDQWWTPNPTTNPATTMVGTSPLLAKSDGADLWVANFTSGTVSRVRASDGLALQTWTGATSAFGVLVALGQVFITGNGDPGTLYRINPQGACCAVTTLTSSLGGFPSGIAFDGVNIWTANSGGSVSIVGPVTGGVITVSKGFITPEGILYDGANIWVTDVGDNMLKKLDPAGKILQSIPVGTDPGFPIFDGTNIWVPNTKDGLGTVSVVRPSTGAVLATLNNNGLNGPLTAAFDGQRVLVTNSNGNSVSLWKAADFTPLGSFLTGGGSDPFGACSDGLNFWITLHDGNQLARF